MIQRKHAGSDRMWCRRCLHTVAAAAACLLALMSSVACSSKPAAKTAQTTKKSSVSSVASSSVSSAAASSSSSASSKISVQKTSLTNSKSKVLKVKNIQQMPELQSGCEITAANIVLNYAGYNTSKTDLLKYLPHSNDFTTVGSKKYGPNPWKTFVGSPDTDRYGCYAPVLANTMNNYILNIQGKHTAYDLTGVSANDLYTCIDHGVPVIVWVTTGMQEPSFGDSWYLTDSGASYRWILKEHCMVLIGYNSTQAIFSDPLDKRGTVSYDKSLFAQRYQSLFSQAVAVW